MIDFPANHAHVSASFSVLIFCPSSSAISSCYSRVYQSLGNLIHWSDQVMLEGVNSEDKEMVTTVKGVIKAVLDGVKVRDFYRMP